MTHTTRALGAALLLAGCGPSARPETAEPHRFPRPEAPPTASAVPVPVPAPAPAPCNAPAFESETVQVALGATCLTADDHDIFWSDGNDVWTAPLEGGSPRKLLEHQGTKPILKIRIAGSQLFLLQKEESSARCIGRVASVDRTGGGLHTIGEEGCVNDFDVRGEWVVYTTEINGDFDAGLQGTLWKARISGGPPSDLFNLFNGTSNVVTDGKYAYAGLAMDQLHRVSLRNSAAVVLNEGVVGGERDGIWHSHFAVDDRHVFFGFGHTNLKGAMLYRMDKEPGAEPALLGRMFPPVDGSKGWPKGDLLQTAEYLYWASTPEGRILRVAKDGHCPVEELATGRERPDYATPAGKYVVWLDLGGEKHVIARRRLEP